MNSESLRYAPSLIVAGLVLLGAYLLAGALAGMVDILIAIFLGAVLGVVMEPIAIFFTRFKVPRVISVIGIYAFVLALIALFAWYAIPGIVDEFDSLVERVETLEEDYADFSGDSGFPDVEQVREYGQQLAQSSGPAVAEQAFAWASILLSLVTVLVVAIFYTAVQGSARKLFLSLVAPRQRDQWDSMLSTMAHRLRRYAIGQLISMLIVGVITYIGLMILGIPFAFTLAMIAFVTEILPIVGPWIGFVPALAIAVTEGWTAVILVSGLYLVIQQLESNVIQPLVQRQQAELPALIVFVAILIGGTLLGILGALAALPATIILHTILTEMIIPWRQKHATEAPPQNGSSADAA